jgi:hypothetical protein
VTIGLHTETTYTCDYCGFETKTGGWTWEQVMAQPSRVDNSLWLEFPRDKIFFDTLECMADYIELNRLDRKKHGKR